MAKTHARAIHRLTPIAVREAKADLDDGGGLVLRVKPSGAAWCWRFTAPDGRRREMGFGRCNRQSLKHAGESLDEVRELVAEARGLLERRIDPLAARQETDANAKAEQARSREEAATKREVELWTLARCARDYHARVIEPKLSTKHAAQWIASLENHVLAKLWHAPIVTITAPQLVAALLAIKPHQRARRFVRADRLGEKRSRVLQRLSIVWDDAIFHERAAANPAGSAARRKIAEGAPKRCRGAHRALPYTEAPAVIRSIAAADGTAAKALAFAVFTAARTSEVLGARWCEFDLDAKVWRIPAERMKAGRSHDVPLSMQALGVLDRVRGLDAELVFPSSVRTASGAARPLSNMAMLTARAPRCAISVEAATQRCLKNSPARLIRRVRRPTRWRYLNPGAEAAIRAD